jgi:uncharacterized protein
VPGRTEISNSLEGLSLNQVASPWSPPLETSAVRPRCTGCHLILDLNSFKIPLDTSVSRAYSLLERVQKERGDEGRGDEDLTRKFHADGHEVVVLGRSQRGWPGAIDGADVVINLAGRSVNCRYTKKNRDEILDSRVSSVRTVGQAIRDAKRPPAVWLQASTATIYAHRYDAPNDETSGLIGGTEPNAPETWRFSIDVVKAWEKALDEETAPGTRKVKLRMAMVMNPDAGSTFKTLLTLVRLGLGGRVGDGRQYISWIHEIDLVRAVYWLIDREHLEGAVNLAAPEPLPHQEFMAALRQAWGTPIGLPATKWMLEIGTALLRTESELILKSRRVVPGRLLEDGFYFQYPEWPDAARELCQRYREKGREH